MLTKKEIRKEILARRKAMSAEEVRAASTLICRRAAGSEPYEKATDICIYMPIRNEVDVTLMIPDAIRDGKGIWIPKVIGEEMIFNTWDEDKLEPSASYGIPESTSDRVLEAGGSTLIIMPGAVFDRRGNRIGYGGGYYDRYLMKHPECMTIAVCYDIQIVDGIPAETHDIRPEMIITEKRVISL